MMKVRREYGVDLTSQTPWEKVIEREADRARSLVDACMRSAEEQASGVLGGSTALTVARKLLPRIHAHVGNVYGDELDEWANGTGIDRDDLVFANLFYEVVGIVAWLEGVKLPWPFGCTSVAFNLPRRRGIAHVRNLDWDLPACGPNTVLFRCEGASGPFTTVGWPGYVGVLSGVAKGRFSITMNLAPQARRPTTDWPAAWAVRRAFEECGTFDEAVRFLKGIKLAAGALLMVAGTTKDQAAVIEHTGDSASTRWMEDGVIAVTNHFEVPRFQRHNPESDAGENECFTSADRLEFALEAAREAGSKPPKDLMAVLEHQRVCCELTVQQMAFIPKSGKCAAKYCDA